MSRQGGPADVAAAGEQDETIAFLSDPGSYEPGVDAVQRIDTHISIVFLAGSRVFKLKRALTLPFLDYGTLEKRRHFCEREVALNRRTAPELYRGARAITRAADGGLEFDGPGAPVDWVVEMERFEADGLFGRRAASGRLTLAMVLEAADAVATLHRGAEVIRADGGGDEHGLDPTIGELRAGLQRYAGILAPERVAACLAGLETANVSCRDLLGRRFEAGRVRLCHGDLHLDNICTFHGRPTIFDAAEANERFVRIDVLYDLAFMLMDLLHRGLTRHANAVLNRYLTRSDDVDADLDGLAALPLFLSARAAIRAEISAMTVANVSDPRMAEGHRAAARGYLRLAENLLAPPPAALVAVGGASGSGKTTAAREVAPLLGAAPGAVLVRSDEVRKALFGVAATARLPASAYTPEWHRRTYAAVAERVRRILTAGHACIVDAVHGSVVGRTAVEALASETGVPFQGIWLDAPEAQLRERVVARTGDASDAGSAVLDAQLASGFGDIRWARVDASGDQGAVAAAAADVLRGGAVAGALRPVD